MDGLRIVRRVHDEIVAHALREDPVECCGLVEIEAGTVVAARAVANVAASPHRFEFGSQDVLEIPRIEERGRTPGIYHSHTLSVPEPSATDLRFGALWPHIPWLIIGTSGAAPLVRCFQFDGGVAVERPLEHC